MKIDRVVYSLKRHCAPVYKMTERAVEYCVYMCHHSRISMAVEDACIEGRINGCESLMRPLASCDFDSFKKFLKAIPDENFRYFRPHGFEDNDLVEVLARRHFLLYGLFVDGEMIGYCLLKLYPGKKAYLGRLLSQDYLGYGPFASS